MAYVKETASGKHQAQVYVKDPYTNERKRLYKTFDEEEDALHWARNKKIESKKGTLIHSQNKKVKDVLLEWLKEHKNDIHENTYYTYESKVKSHLIPRLGHLKIENFKRRDVAKYFKYKRKNGRLDGKEGGLSENSLKKHYIVLKLAMKYAKDNDLIIDNPVLKYKCPRPEKNKAEAMSEEEVNQLLKTAHEVSPWMYRYIAIDVLTGLRRGELSALTWDKINLTKEFIVINRVLSPVRGKGTILKEKTKNKASNRVIPITDKVVKLLSEHKREQNKRKDLLKDKYNDSVDFVFAKEFGGHYGIRYFNDKFNEILEKANLPQKYGIHTLRHTFVTINIERGTDKEAIMASVGHASYSTTVDIYGHLSLNKKREASNTVSDSIDLI